MVASPYPAWDQAGLYVLIEQLAVSANCSNPRRAWVVTIDDEFGTLKVWRPDCRLWSCPQCALHNRHAWMHKIMYGVQAYRDAGEEFSFATLTANRFRRGFSKTLWDWRAHWPVLHKRIKRYIDMRDFHYVMLPELHSDRSLHMHVIWNAVFPGKKVERKDGSVYYRSKWLADNGAETGLGWVHDNRPLGSTASASSYVTKYITKTLDVPEWPAYLRRIRTSNHWPVHKPDKEPSSVLYETFRNKHFLVDYLLWAVNQGYHIKGYAGRS